MLNKEIDNLMKRYKKVSEELNSLAWKEHEQGFGTLRRAKISRKCDILAIEKRNIRNRLFDEFNIELK